MPTSRRGIVPACSLLAIAALIGSPTPEASAHTALVRVAPGPGAALTVAPKLIRLTFSERPDASLSEVRVLGSDDAPVGSGPVAAAGANQLVVPIRRLSRGSYTVSWRVVSAVDGHQTSGHYAFGVGVTPGATGLVVTASTSSLEFLARWILLIGLVALLGAALAGAAHLSVKPGLAVAGAALGWGTSLLGLGLLSEAQRGNADASLAAFLETSTGRAVIWDAVALAAAGAALALARRIPAVDRAALSAAALAAVGAIAVHVGVGHAAAGDWAPALTIAAQVAHFTAAGVWFGGLAVLLCGLRGEPSDAKAIAVRRFGVVAASALLVVLATGTLRTVDELGSVGQLFSTGYGRAVLAKIVLIALIAAIAARNRRPAPTAPAGLRSLRLGGIAESALAVCALAVAALLGTLAPPAPLETATRPGLSVTGADIGNTVEARLTTAVAHAGPNRFRLSVDDPESGDDAGARQVSLRFVPLDDPGVNPSTLRLKRRPGGTFGASGRNLAFDGRWRIDARIEVEGERLEVPLQLDLAGPKYFVSVERVPGMAPKYTMQIGGIGYIRIQPTPERPGSSRVFVTSYTAFENVSQVESLVLTAAQADGPTFKRPVRRLGSGRFVGEVELGAGANTIGVVAHTRDGTRLRAVFGLQVPDD